MNLYSEDKIVKHYNRNKNTFEIQNKQVNFNYTIKETLECGMVLTGTEVRAMVEGLCSLKESWVDIVNGELILKQCHISVYSRSFNNFDTLEPTRNRKLLAHKKQIRYLSNKVSQQGYTLIPTKIYQSDNHKFKIEVALCEGKHEWDKRETIKKRDIEREKSREIAERFK